MAKDHEEAPITGSVVTFTYVNYRGEVSSRRVIPKSGSLSERVSPHHHQKQWLFDAWDMDKWQWRTFAMKDVSEWKQEIIS